MAFYRRTTSGGALSFTLAMALEGGDLLDYRCHFVPGSLALAGVQGDTYTSTAELEAFPQDGRVLSAAHDQALIDQLPGG